MSIKCCKSLYLIAFSLTYDIKERLDVYGLNSHNIIAF